MLSYPQLRTGALVQWPMTKRVRHRSATLVTRGGTWHSRYDAGAKATEWEINYEGLLEEEANVLESFFRLTEGRYREFLFPDPLANLLAWSEAWDKPEWEYNSLVSMQTGVADPQGGTRAATITNGSQGQSGIQQVLESSGTYLYCFSAWLNGTQGTKAKFCIGDTGMTFVTRGGWERYEWAAVPGADDLVRFAIELDPGAVLGLYGPQVEAQPSASAYKRSAGAGGCHREARFDQDRLILTADGPDSYGARVRIVSMREE